MNCLPFLNPLETGTEHRLLVTTRIRDLMPRATRVELPLMNRDEAVALMLDLANVQKEAYAKQYPGSEWPPKAAYTIAAECGLLPITLTIAAQVVSGCLLASPMRDSSLLTAHIIF